MKKTKTAKKQSKGANNMSAQKLGVMLGALESKVAPGVLSKPSTCHRFEYCL